MKKKKIIITISIILTVLSLILLAYFIYLNVNSDSTTNCVSQEKKDTIPPAIILKGNMTQTLNIGDIYQEQGCLAADNIDGDLSSKVVINGYVDTEKVGEYQITYFVVDSSKNSTTVTRKVNVVQGKTKAVSSSVINKVNENVRGLPVLMYHFFYDSKSGEKGKDNNWIEIQDFENQMKYLSDNDFYFPSWTEVEEFINKKRTLPDNSIVITVDDGDESFIRLAIPVIEKYQVKVTSFLVTSWNGDWVVPQYASNKLNFQSHSHNMHQAGKDGKGVFLSLSKEKALNDITTSKDMLKGATIFCYPFGQYTEQNKVTLKQAGYRLAFTTKNGRVYPGSDPYALPRIRMSKGESLSSFKSKVK